MTLTAVATSMLPTEHGLFDLTVFTNPENGEEHVVLSKGLSNQPADDAPLVRLHSECLTGDAFRSLRCDCGPQLAATLQRIEAEGRGAVLYLRQEGRGIGLANKIRAYALQDQGHDTVDANLLLDLPADAREYSMCRAMLDFLGVNEVRLMTNNPLKVEALESLGIRVRERVPLHVGEGPHNRQYLLTKQQRMGHLR